VDGHIAYNMPGPVRLGTHVTRLPDGLAASLAVPPGDWPLRAITMGIGTIRAARRILVLATGESKVTAVQRLVHGPDDPHWPCSFLHTHPNLDLIADRAAASLL
jgi:glucosamine-6-phosphate deaminase